VINIEAHWVWWSLVLTSVFCVASVIRLSRFTVSGYVEKNKKYYTGLPVLFSKYALLLCLFFNAKLSLLILAAMIPMMVSSKLVKKPHALFAQLELLYALIFLTLYFRHG
jgi:phosphatidylserine synthase